MATEQGFSLESEPERHDDGTQCIDPQPSDAASTDPRPALNTGPTTGASAWPTIILLLLALGIGWSLYLGFTMPQPVRERPAPDEPWTPSSGICEGMTALECKWN